MRYGNSGRPVNTFCLRKGIRQIVKTVCRCDVFPLPAPKRSFKKLIAYFCLQYMESYPRLASVLGQVSELRKWMYMDHRW